MYITFKITNNKYHFNIDNIECTFLQTIEGEKIIQTGTIGVVSTSFCVGRIVMKSNGWFIIDPSRILKPISSEDDNFPILFINLNFTHTDPKILELIRDYKLEICI